ncbi:hypothetical protein MCAP1_002291 [Malassezia caprae]|uniref:Uncharacterized protein n=1 Tax=Malassezia caprae TaxID=1381934 RepID=A0AAF0IWI7_9BASI|nr:hypothetical protein MCAP1_002291 [Malassezia caprae]
MREQAAHTQIEPKEPKQISADKAEPDATADSKMENKAKCGHLDEITEDKKSVLDEHNQSDKSKVNLDNKEQPTKDKTGLIDEKKNDEENSKAQEISLDPNSDHVSASNTSKSHDVDRTRDVSDPPEPENTEALEPTHGSKEPVQKGQDGPAVGTELGDHQDTKQADDQKQHIISETKANDEESDMDPKEKAKMKAKIKAKAKKARKKAEKEQMSTQNSQDVSQVDDKQPTSKIEPTTSSDEPANLKHEDGIKATNESSASSENKEKLDQPDTLGDKKESTDVKLDSSMADAALEKEPTEHIDTTVPKLEEKTEVAPAEMNEDETRKSEDKSNEAVQKRFDPEDGNPEIEQQVSTEKLDTDALYSQDKADKNPTKSTDVQAPGSDKMEQVSADTINDDVPKSERKDVDVSAGKDKVEALKSEGDVPEPAHLNERTESNKSVEQPIAEPKQNMDVELEGRRAPNDTASMVTKHSIMSKYASSVSAYSVMADKALQGKLDALPAQVQKDLQVKAYQVPPSISGKDDGRFPWSGSTWSSSRAFEMLKQQPKGRDMGTQWSEISGSGDATSSVSQEATLDIISTLFVPDPRTWRPYRFVRRTNPRQVLLMCAGTALSPQQIRSAEIAHRVAAGLMPREEATKSLASYYSTTENTNLQAGLGFIYSPDKAICKALREDVDVTRVEKNFSRRLERPEFPATTTRHRAALRSVIAALEYIRWEEEGFDKIVVLGLPGENVPDRDLWELLDYVVRHNVA